MFTVSTAIRMFRLWVPAASIRLLLVLTAFQASIAASQTTKPNSPPNSEEPLTASLGTTKTFDTSSGPVTITIVEASAAVFYADDFAALNRLDPAAAAARKKQQAEYITNLRSASRPTGIGLEIRNVSDPAAFPGIKEVHTNRGDFEAILRSRGTIGGFETVEWTPKLAQGEIALLRCVKFGFGEHSCLVVGAPVAMTDAPASEQIKMLFNPSTEVFAADWQRALQQLTRLSANAAIQKQISSHYAVKAGNDTGDPFDRLEKEQDERAAAIAAARKRIMNNPNFGGTLNNEIPEAIWKQMAEKELQADEGLPARTVTLPFWMALTAGGVGVILLGVIVIQWRRIKRLSA